ncbi:hypothetical protein [Sinanaerobacter sp. ZZT-01]|uniref:hypothetical protein n=1 Tax=Sinanaerobacter sp. ZZT-01 TaxID=3111540 RepID=UPI002D78F2E6|nr:hypothetical protein [Sinanaerobacter sp. ZZT-01]WRR92671.1 hypothetical protein U5921_11540 [Sinanaerobacter sp. ZZT-01]
MRKQEVQKIFKNYDITLTELKEVYSRVVKQAKQLWKEDCIQEDSGRGIGKLYAQVGFNSNEGLMGRADWHFSGWSGETEVWYYALKINLLDDAMDYTAANASDYLYEDPYYRRTGQISQKALQECFKGYPLDFKTFEEVAVELAEGLADKG